MNPKTLSELRNTSGIFDRAAEMPRPRRKRPSGPGRELVIDQRCATAKVHPDLPATPAWTYDGLLPGPVVVVRAGDRVQMTHEHNIVGTLPYRHVVVDDDVGGTMNDAGSDFLSIDPDGFLVTPHVMRFDLGCGHCHSGIKGQPIAAMPLDPDFRRVSTDHHDLPADHGHTIIALLEEQMIERDDNGVPRKNSDGTVITHPMLYLTPADLMAFMGTHH